MNISLARQCIETLVQMGVREFCICAGARNSPFVVNLDDIQGLLVHRFFEERSAAFFALGRIQRDGRPVAVITTSGTAAAELLPAAIEATYSNLPLLLVTADRPQSYRGTGAPQSIEQVGIFSHYVEQCIDVSAAEHLSAALKWSMQKPLQLNVCFAEPLIDEKLEKINLPDLKAFSMPPAPSSRAEKVELNNPLIIVGPLKEQDRALVIKNLLRWKSPVYAEALSGLRGEESLQSLLIKSGEKTLQEAFQKNLFDSVLRLGGVPTLRLWRDLEDKYLSVPVTSVSANDFTGLSKKVHHLRGYTHLESIRVIHSKAENFFSLDNERYPQLLALLESFPQSEPGIFFQLAKKLTGQSIYVGNSMPVREWDLCATTDLKFRRISGNRGANGIDGQVSSFLGWSHEESENWAVLGDLTALYDLSALWMCDRTSDFASKKPMRIVVINNRGGQIFKNIFRDERFINRHQTQFQKWAEMFHWSYQSWEKVPQTLPVLYEREIIEIFPREYDSDSFWREYQKL